MQRIYETNLAPSDFGVIDADRLTKEQLMAEIQKGIDSAETEKLYTTSEVLNIILAG